MDWIEKKLLDKICQISNTSNGQTVKAYNNITYMMFFYLMGFLTYYLISCLNMTFSLLVFGYILYTLWFFLKKIFRLTYFDKMENPNQVFTETETETSDKHYKEVISLTYTFLKNLINSPSKKK